MIIPKMKHYLILLTNCVIILSCFCCTKGNNSEIKIDLSIKSEVEKHISNSSFALFSEKNSTAYYNEIDAELYLGNSDSPRILLSDTTDVLFKSFFYPKLAFSGY